MKKLVLLFLAGLLCLTAGYTQESSRKKQYNLKNGLAIDGYDPVAYFKQGRAVKGNKEFSVSYQETLYYFSSADNKEEFRKNPSLYEPQYGGWCAYAMGASGEKVDIDPETFKIINNKLYLFYHSWVNNTLTKWNKEERTLKINADKSWQVFNH